MKSINCVKRAAISTCILFAFAGLTGCGERIESGKIGVRVNFDKTIDKVEYKEGDFAETIIGDVFKVIVKEIAVSLPGLTPLTKDNSIMKSFDMSVNYKLNPDYVADVYVEKSKEFHNENSQRDVLLMYNYVYDISKNAAYEEAKLYDALDMANNRENLELKIKNKIVSLLKSEGLADAILINQVRIRNILPADSIITSTNALIDAKNILIKKETDIKIAQLEAERLAILEKHSRNIESIGAQANLNISEGVKSGKVNTVIVPSNKTTIMPITNNKDN